MGRQSTGLSILEFPVIGYRSYQTLSSQNPEFGSSAIHVEPGWYKTF